MENHFKRPKKKFVYRKKRLSEQIKDGYRMVIGSVLVMSLVFSFAYIRLQTQNAVLGYYVSQLRAENEILLSQNYDISHKELVAQSMLNLQGETAQLQMFAADPSNIAYTRENIDIAVLPIFVDQE